MILYKRAFELWSHKHTLLITFFGLLFILIGVRLDQFYLMLVPPFIMLGLLLLKNLHWAYYLFFFLVPFSIEIYLPNGLGTNIPSEPLMWILCSLGIVWILHHSKNLDSKSLLHPMTILICVHFVWIVFTSINSSVPLISFKFLLAKGWYLFPFYFMVLFLGEKPLFFKTIASYLGIALLAAVIFVFIKHSFYDFSFRDINKAVSPIFRNHVNYACILVIVLPLVWYLQNMARIRSGLKIFWSVVCVALLVGIYFSFTRAAHVSVFIAIISYYLIKYRLMKWAVGLTILGLILISSFFLSNETYLNYAPKYEKTITHFEFDDLLSATTKGQDISTMERVYRWVAGWEMFKSRPLVGFGPGTFYSNYTSYTVSSFKTYVSNNPDKSGIHNYYLMTLAEQGIFGFLILMSLCFYALIAGERVYHTCRNNEEKLRIMAVILMLIIVNSILIINDMLEVDKVGPFYFMGLAFIVIQDLKNRDVENKEKFISAENLPH